MQNVQVFIKIWSIFWCTIKDTRPPIVSDTLANGGTVEYIDEDIQERL